MSLKVCFRTTFFLLGNKNAVPKTILGDQFYTSLMNNLRNSLFIPSVMTISDDGYNNGEETRYDSFYGRLRTRISLLGTNYPFIIAFFFRVVKNACCLDIGVSLQMLLFICKMYHCFFCICLMLQSCLIWIGVCCMDLVLVIKVVCLSGGWWCRFV